MEPKRKKRLTKEEMEERKKEDKARKDAKKKLAEELKRLNPKECMKVCFCKTKFGFPVYWFITIYNFMFILVYYCPH